MPQPTMKSESRTIAVDFDGTCVTHEFPAVGKDIGAAPVLRALVNAGHKLVLNTMRSDGRADGSTPLSDAVAWFERNSLPLYGINHNPDQDSWTSSPKVYAHLYLDDAAFGAPLRCFDSVQRPFFDWFIAIRGLDGLINMDYETTKSLLIEIRNEQLALQPVKEAA